MTAAQLLDALDGARYVALEVELEPLGSPTLQPTTFANTGPSFYEAPSGELAAVVDSVASMANQLELTIWDEAGCKPTPPVAPLPWLRVVDGNGDYYTSSRRAAHRLNAHALMNGAVEADGEVFGARIDRLLADAKPPVTRRLAEVVWEHDPLAILHGCWFAGIWDGRARLTRALSARIDALSVQSQSVQVGGQKTADHALEVTTRQAGAEGKTVEGEVPHYMSEVSAARIVSPFVLDLALLRSYGLRDASYRALVATALLQIGELIAAWPRRRSRCILLPREVRVRLPEGWQLPDLDELREECFRRCREATGVDRAEPLVVRYVAKPRKSD
ncbi:MAG: type I-U CRISPR-associated protein Cas7 [Thermoleophilia bacterium]